MTCLLQGSAGVLQGFLSIYLAGLGLAHQNSGRVVHTGDSTAQFIPNLFYGVAIWRSCRLLHLGDIVLLNEIKVFPSMVTCGVIVLVAVVIPEKLPAKWHWGVLQNVPVEPTGEVYVGEPKKRYGTTVKSSPDGYWTITSLDPISLAPLMEVLAR